MSREYDDKARRLGLWVTAEEKKTIRRLAKEEDRTLSYFVRMLIREALEARGIEA